MIEAEELGITIGQCRRAWLKSTERAGIQRFCSASKPGNGEALRL